MWKSTATGLAMSATLFASFSVFAEPITIGALSSNDDGSTHVIVDSLNGLEWLRWDLTKHLTYAETQAAIGPGGTYDGFKLAGIGEKTLFLNALLSDSANACDETIDEFGKLCGITGLNGGTRLLGFSFHSMFPAVMFLSDNGGGAEVGLFLVHDVGGSVLSQNDAFSITFSDAEYSGDIDDPGNVSWLLYRSTVQSTSELISNLIDTISEINQVAGIGRSFDAKFRSIVQVLDDANANNDGAALNGLYALCSYVEAQRGKKLTNAQADDIVAGADHVISSLNAFAPMCD